MPPDTYTIVDLARLTGVNVRTIRYYLAQGLLPASGESGPGAHYGEGHLDRLRLTKRLQQQHLPLSEIRGRLAELTDDQVAGLANVPAEPQPIATTSALDYIRTVLGTPGHASSSSLEIHAAQPSPPSPAAPSPMSPPPPPASREAPARLLRRAFDAPKLVVSAARGMPAGEVGQSEVEAAASPPPPRAAATPATPAPADQSTHEPPPLERSQWERLSLGPNVELHIRRPLSRLEQRRVERLITIARQVLKENEQ
jgi:DNA-binding transcriptional MerR regulator